LLQNVDETDHYPDKIDLFIFFYMMFYFYGRFKLEHFHLFVKCKARQVNFRHLNT
jgi:hypothetical protein